MRASVVIPAHNRHHDVQRAVRSLEVQVRARDDVELIVVDDGSDPPLANSLDGGDGTRYFTIVRNESVAGRSAARNRGFKASTGEVIVFMDSDMTAHPRFIDKHLEVHERIESVAVVGRVIWTGISRLHNYLETRGVKKLKRNQDVPGRYFDSSNASMRRADFERVGPFHEGIREWGGEDTLMGFNLHEERVPIVYLRSAITYHHSAIDLDELCRRNYTFGRCSLPLLVSSRPKLARELRTHYLVSPHGEEVSLFSRSGAAGILVRGLLRFPGHRVVKRILAASGRRLSFLCFDYLVYSSILRGFRDSLPVGSRRTGKGEASSEGCQDE